MARITRLDPSQATTLIALLSLAGLALHLILRAGVDRDHANVPLVVVIALGGAPLLLTLLRKLLAGKFGSDLVGGVSVVTSILLGEYLAGSIIVLMLAGGDALERYALRSASSVLDALARRMPTVAHRRRGAEFEDVALSEVAIGDVIVIYPHEISPVDGVVTDGRGVMDESFLTGEPFQMTKTVGSAVISGAINGDAVLTIRALRLAHDSRYAKIMDVMRESEQTRPRLRRLGDQLGAVYTPISLAVAAIAWAASGEPQRFLAVLVIATPCPLLIAIPVAIIGAISLSAKRGIIIRNPVVLEQVADCRTAIFDKTGTLTYGLPTLTEIVVAPGVDREQVLHLVASLERYSKHPLARAVLDAARPNGRALLEATEVSEPPGAGLSGRLGGHTVEILSRHALRARTMTIPDAGAEGGLECMVVVDGQYAAIFRFRDAPRSESRTFVQHLGPKHQFDRMLIVSGDRDSEVRYLAEQVGISEVHSQQSPEQKLALVRRETSRARTLYVGDGINDAPAMMAATVGVAIGQSSDVTTEAAGVVIMDNSLRRVDEFLHISRRMRTIALQSAVGGMALSVAGMLVASSGLLTPVAGAICQEVIDVVAVLNALRAASSPALIHDF